MLYNNKVITFAKSITVLLIMMHSSLFVTLHQNYCLEMDGTTANYSFIWVHINWLYLGCNWILCQHDNWTIILSAQSTTNLHTYLIRHERNFSPAYEVGNSVCLECCKGCYQATQWQCKYYPSLSTKRKFSSCR